MRIVFIGSVDFSRHTLLHLVRMKAHVVGVCCKSVSNFNADFSDLKPTCEELQIPCLHVNDINECGTVDWIKKLQPDVIFCFGWSSLLKREILSLTPFGVIGYHPAALPLNRGRHPLIWALALGLTKTASSFFLMDESADGGDIVSQFELFIDFKDDASSLYKKMVKTAKRQLDEILPALELGRLQRIKQNHVLVNYWRKREPKDGRIDWRMNSIMIYNLIRALAKPYVGAEFIWRDQIVKVWKSGLAVCADSNIEPGKILKVQCEGVVIKCGVGAIFLMETTPSFLPNVGEYL